MIRLLHSPGPLEGEKPGESHPGKLRNCAHNIVLSGRYRYNALPNSLPVALRTMCRPQKPRRQMTRAMLLPI
jgi:hypothetical protein